MKRLVVVADGMADRPLPERFGKTPLELAHTPHMDRLAREGAVGLARTVPPGMHPGSEVAIMSILGYDPRRFYRGRGPIEAASLGEPLAEGETAFRCNLITVREGILADYSAGHIPTAEAAPLVAALQEALGGPEVRFRCGRDYRHLLVVRGDFEGLSTQPPHDLMGQPIEAHLPADPRLRRLMEEAARLLGDHPVNRRRVARGEPPANAIWPWGQGGAMRLPPFPWRGAVIAAVDLVRGLGALCGLRVVDVPGATGFLDTNYEGKARAALEALREGEFALVHVEAPDEASHQGSLEQKLRAIEDLDRRLLGPLLAGLRDVPHRLLLLPDHPTPLELRTHAAEPVPFVVSPSAGPHAPSFCERAAASTGLFVAEGHRLWTLLER